MGVPRVLRRWWHKDDARLCCENASGTSVGVIFSSISLYNGIVSFCHVFPTAVTTDCWLSCARSGTGALLISGAGTRSDTDVTHSVISSQHSEDSEHSEHVILLHACGSRPGSRATLIFAQLGRCRFFSDRKGFRVMILEAGTQNAKQINESS